MATTPHKPEPAKPEPAKNHSVAKTEEEHPKDRVKTVGEEQLERSREYEKGLAKHASSTG